MNIGFVEVLVILLVLGGAAAAAAAPFVTAKRKRELWKWLRRQLDGPDAAPALPAKSAPAASGGSSATASAAPTATAQFNDAVRTVAHDLGLTHVPRPQHYDAAEGSISGRRISIVIDAPAGSTGNAHPMRIDMDLAAGAQFHAKAQGAASANEAAAGSVTRLGIDAFDRQVDLRGAPASLVSALERQPGLRDLLIRVVQFGAVASGQGLNISVRPMACDALQIRNYLDAMLDLARRLEHPNDSHEHPATGTPAAAKLRRVERLPAAQRTVEFRSIVDRVTVTLGEGQSSEVNGEIEWRGRYQQQIAVRIHIDTSGKVRIFAEAPHQHGEIHFEWNSAAVNLAASRHAQPLLFIGRGVYFGGAPDQIDIHAIRYLTLPPQAGPGLFRAMAADKLQSIRALPQAVEIVMQGSLSDMLDPEGQLTRATQLAGWFIQVLASTPVDPAVAQLAHGSSTASLAPLNKRGCDQCGTQHLIVGTDYRCPNCITS